MNKLSQTMNRLTVSILAVLSLLFVTSACKEKVNELTLTPAADGQIHLDYVLQPQKFERIRRITGYLVGTIDRWNDAKRAEEHDRVKHTVMH